MAVRFTGSQLMGRMAPDGALEILLPHTLSFIDPKTGYTRACLETDHTFAGFDFPKPSTFSLATPSEAVTTSLSATVLSGGTLALKNATRTAGVSLRNTWYNHPRAVDGRPALSLYKGNGSNATLTLTPEGAGAFNLYVPEGATQQGLFLEA